MVKVFIIALVYLYICVTALTIQFSKNEYLNFENRGLFNKINKINADNEGIS